MRLCLFAACLLAATAASVPALASGVDPDAATPLQREQAQSRFGRGRQLFEQKKYREALGEFEGSHDIVASPNARLYIAHCRRELGELVAAYEEFGRAATEARERATGDPRYLKTAEAAERERDALAPKLGFVTITVEHATADTKLTIAGEEIKSAAWSEAAPVLPGTTEILAQTPGRPPGRTTATVSAGERKRVTVDAGLPAPVAAAPEPAPAPPPPPEGPTQPTRTIAYLSGGIGVIGFATFAVFGMMAKSTYDGLQRECSGPCTSDHSGEIHSGETQQTVANVGLVVGAVGAVAGVTLFLVSRPAKREAPAAALQVGPSWVGVRGVF
ncbi:MAG TPA: tetratricopeptide repeat protein [Polyangiaceae bacterium]|jgi:hypothetical protein